MSKIIIIRTGSGNITANNVCLGWFLTDRFRQGHALKEQMAQGMSEAEAINSIAQDIPTGRTSKPEVLGLRWHFWLQNKQGILLGPPSGRWRLGSSGVLRLD